MNLVVFAEEDEKGGGACFDFNQLLDILKRVATINPTAGVLVADGLERERVST